ncbi:alpha/beta fold hydrolase (plasmid) [Paracoccus marcusii]|uniref:alpha/beta fold hydrolase n=2 Tax=Paracoccus TaxID=265 RepID=UPI0038BB9334|nr:Sigma factor SigB regulation protein RsbQ [Paracoccus marcusii]
MMFAHGFGCDQAMWRFVAPRFENAFKVVTCDHVGSGGSDVRAYDPQKYASIDGYADDLVEIGSELGIHDGILVGHSVSAMICALASIRAPEMFRTLVMVCPSPRYIDDENYVGGFSAEDVDDLLASLAENPMAWSASVAPAIMGNASRPELGEELTESFCRLDPQIANDFARATFTSDNRADLLKVTARTLILQCRDDIIAPECVGQYVRDHVADSELVLLSATGHCPNLSAPDEVVAAIREFA